MTRRPFRPDHDRLRATAPGPLAWLVLATVLGIGGYGLLGDDDERLPPAQDAVVQAREAAQPQGPQPKGAAGTSHAPTRLASFGTETPSDDVRHVANWAVHSGDPGDRSFVIVDKKQATVWLFDPRGELIGTTPALMGAAVGDDAVPGIGEKPLAQVLPEEKTTPAGRYVAEPGENADGEDVVWVSYDLAVSMHRVRPLVKSERRLERLASATPEDNRISFGCINLPVTFYETVLKPVVQATGAIIYVLPETRSPQAQFGSYAVDGPAVLALSSALAPVK